MGNSILLICIILIWFENIYKVDENNFPNTIPLPISVNSWVLECVLLGMS